MVDPDYTATVSLDRDQARALLAAADAGTGARAMRTAAAVRLLLHNALYVDEACAADITDLREDAGPSGTARGPQGRAEGEDPAHPGHRGGHGGLPADRARRAGVGEWRQLTGALLATATGGRLRQGHLWELVRRLACTAGIGARE